MPKPTHLTLGARGNPGIDNPNLPTSPKSPGSPSISEGGYTAPNPAFHMSSQPPSSPKPRREAKHMFSNLGASKSSSRLNSQDVSTRPSTDPQRSPGPYTNGRSGSSTPDLGRPVRTPNSDDNGSDDARINQKICPQTSNDMSVAGFDAMKRNAAKPKNKGLSGTKTTKADEMAGNRTRLNKAPPPQLSPDIAGPWASGTDGMSLRTAPMEKGQSWRQGIGIGKLRTHSADRHDGMKHAQREDDNVPKRDRSEQVSLPSNSYNESKGATLMSSLGFGARKMGEKMDSARKGVFGKLGRSSSNHESQTSISNEPYVCKIIHRPLVEQTRLTRISTRLEQSRDKTEFWMPALPWRCIDYLNMRGCEEEGLYRVPGSAQQVRYYERKFDEDRDIDLISDPNLNDPNVIGSLFKNWLRQLPDEIFPKAIQAAIQQECQGEKTTPQMLKDELSKLPPFNYYLLFAITCHISLLHSCSEFNKMNYNNLCICFQPAIKIDAFCFQFLILDWRNCWQGCWTEKDFLTDELAFLKAMQNEGSSQSTSTRNGSVPTVGKSKSSSQVNQAQKPISSRNNSTDHIKTSSRNMSTDRNGRAAPTQSAAVLTEPSRLPTARIQNKPPERMKPSVDGRDGLHPPGAVKRVPMSNSKRELMSADQGAPSAQAELAPHGLDTTQFRLDLRDSPSSPFTIKF